MRNTWKKAAAFTLAMALVVGAAPANVGTGGLFGGTAITASAVGTTDYTIDMTAQGFSTGETVNSVQDSAKIVTVTFDKGTNNSSPKYYNGGTAVRVYGGSTMTVSADSVITSIEFTFGSSDGRNAISANTGTYSEDDRKWTSDGSTKSVTFTVGGTSGNRRIQALKVTVENAAVPATDISTATVNLAADNTVASLTIGNDTINDLSDFDITYGTDDSHTATAPPTEAGTYYAYVTAKADSNSYTGTAKSAAFEVAEEDHAVYKSGTVKVTELKNGDILAPGVTLTYDETANFGQIIDITEDTGAMLSAYYNTYQLYTVKITNDGLYAEHGWRADDPENYVTNGLVDSFVNGNNAYVLKRIDCYTPSDGRRGENDYWFEQTKIELTPEISSASVSLGDDLALNFYVDGIADETAAAEYTVNFTGACVDESSALAYNATEGKYYATTHVYAKDIDKNITATLCKGDDTVDTVEDYSISQYLSSDAFSGADEKTSALITATKDFGNASSEYFYGTGSGYSDGFASYNPDVSAYAPNFDSNAAKLSLVLDSKTAARLYVKDDTTGAESTINATKADYPTYHEVAGLLPQNLADEQTINVGGTDYKFSALTWCNRVLNNTNASTKNVNMAKAIMAYYTAAANYTDNTIQLAVGDLNFTYTEGQTWNDITLPDGVGIDSENHIIYNNRILSYNSSGAWVTADTEIGSPAGYYWETIYVDSVTLNQSTLTLTAGGDTATLTATVLPDNATDKTVTWSSDNEAVATVVDGVVTPVAKGTATITATSGGKSDTCTVTVRQLYSFTLTGPYTGETLVVEYYEGDTWNDMVAKYPNTLKVYSGYVAFGSDGFIYDERGDWFNATDQIDPNKTYEVQ